MGCSKNLYELFGATGPEYPLDEIWYLGYSAAESVYPYTDAPQDVTLDTGFIYPKISIGGATVTDLVSTGFGGFVTIPEHPDALQGALLADNQVVTINTSDYCIPTLSSTDPYLNDGTPTQPGFYFFLRRVESGTTCTTFSQVQVLQISIGPELPQDMTIDVECDGNTEDCYDATQHLDPNHPNFAGGTAQCMYPVYNEDYWDSDPTCINLTSAGVYVITYTIPASEINTVFDSADCVDCNTDDLTITITLTVGGSNYVAEPKTFCN